MEKLMSPADALIAAMSEYSESTYCARWLYNIEVIIWDALEQNQRLSAAQNDLLADIFCSQKPYPYTYLCWSMGRY